MEKLYARLIAILVCIVFTSNFYAQDSYGVFKVSGTPKVLNSGTIKKGDIIKNGDKIITSLSDEIILVDSKGQLYKVSNVTSTNYTDLPKFKSEIKSESLSKKYLTYVYSKMTNNVGKNDNIGAVYRNNYLYLQLSPSDSIKIYNSEINFVWVADNETETSYFLLKENGSSHITKLGIKGNTLNLFVDNNLLKTGKEYDWAVSNSQFPAMDEIKMHNFTVLSSAHFNALKPEIESLKKEFAALGFNDDEIKKIICLDFKICY